MGSSKGETGSPKGGDSVRGRKGPELYSPAGKPGPTELVQRFSNLKNVSGPLNL
jgi:hypothetical protein